MKAVKVTLRKRLLPSGKITLYLDYYPPLRDPVNYEDTKVGDWAATLPDPLVMQDGTLPPAGLRLGRRLPRSRRTSGS